MAVKDVGERERGLRDMETGERRHPLAGAKKGALAHKGSAEHETAEGARHTTDLTPVEAMIENWPRSRGGPRQRG